MDNSKEKKELNLDELKAYNNAFAVSERKILIAEMLQLLRQNAGLTQNEVANYIGIKAGTYSTYENGTREAPAEIIVRLSILYDVSCDIILQQSRYARDNYEAQKQIDFINEQLDELRGIISDRENELNPQFAEMIQAMTDAFSKMGDEMATFNENLQNK